MTGNMRNSLGLLAVALIGALLGLALLGVEPARDVAAILLLGALVLGVIGLARIAADLLRTPQRD